jgi:Protein of unknown function (DUF742)
MVTYSAVARVSRSASTGPPGSTLGSQRRSWAPSAPCVPLGINRLGVIQVLVGDMADDHLVMVYRPTQVGNRPDLALLERVLYGLPTSGQGLRIGRAASVEAHPAPMDVESWASSVWRTTRSCSARIQTGRPARHDAPWPRGGCAGARYSSHSARAAL